MDQPSKSFTGKGNKQYRLHDGGQSDRVVVVVVVVVVAV